MVEIGKELMFSNPGSIHRADLTVEMISEADRFAASAEDMGYATNSPKDSRLRRDSYLHSGFFTKGKKRHRASMKSAVTTSMEEPVLMISVLRRPPARD